MSFSNAYYSLVVISLLISSSIYAQQDSTNVEDQLEEAFEEFDEDALNIEGERLVQFLEDLSNNPVNINKAGLSKLIMIPGINLNVAKAVVAFRKVDVFRKKEDLLKIEGIESDLYKRISSYVTVGNHVKRDETGFSNPKFWFKNPRIEYITRYQRTLEDREGFLRPDTSGGFIGNAGRYFQRLRYQSEHLSINFTQEKDAGEELNSINDFDFNSFHVQIRDVGVLNSLVVGDYSMTFGQGLVLWNGGAFGKGREVISSSNRRERGLKAYSSAQETDFFRGFAASLGNKVEGTIFYSNRKLTSSIANGDTVRFPSSSGFHRTRSEIERRNNINQESFGVRLRVLNEWGIFGVTTFHNSFNKFIAPSNSLSSRYSFSGNQNSLLGADYRINLDRLLLYGEVARSVNEAYAGIVGAEVSIASRTSLVLNYRNFEKDFQSFYGNAFGEASGDPRNEEGFYIGLKHTFREKFSFSTYFDQYKFDSPRSGLNQPSMGYDILILGELRVNRDLSGYILYRNEIRDDEYVSWDEFGREIRLLGDSKRNSLRAQIEFQANSKLRLRSRVEVVKSSLAKENQEFGLLIFQDVRFKAANSLKLDFRVSVFDTDSFNARVFQFENDLRYVMTNTALFGSGQRLYILVTLDLSNNLELSTKYSVTVFEDVFSVSSGLNQIDGNIRSAIGLQLSLKL